MLLNKLNDDDVSVFLAQLGDPDFTVYHIALLWNMEPHDVMGYRKCLTRDARILIPEVRHIACNSVLVHLYRKEVKSA
jgi:hypothetical protein